MRNTFLPSRLAALCLGCWLLLPALAAPAGNDPAPPLTLDQALTQAATHSRSISAAQHEAAAAQAALSQAQAWRNPQLNLSAEDTQRTTRTTAASLDIPIEWGGKRASRIEAASRAQAVADAQLDQVRAELRADVLQAFFALWVAQERAELSARSADLARRGADAIGRRVVAGKLSPVDESRARVDEANAQLEADEAWSEQQGARQNLAALWNQPEAVFTAVASPLDSLPQRPELSALMPWLDTAPALRLRRAQTERLRALTEVERSKAFPELTLKLGGQRNNELGRSQALVGLSLPLPLFDRNQGAILEAARRAAQAEDEEQLARTQLRSALMQACQRLASARRSALALSNQVLPAAQQAYDAASRGFEAGKFGFNDVIDAQRSLLQARSRHLAVLAAAHQAAAAIDRLSGR